MNNFITLLLAITCTTKGILAQEILYNKSFDNNKLWEIKKSAHQKNLNIDSYSIKHIIYLQSDNNSELDKAMIKCLQTFLPEGEKVSIIAGNNDIEEIRKKNTSAHIFSIQKKNSEVQTNTSRGIKSNVISILWLKMYDALGPKQSVELNELMCYPVNVIANISIRNIISLHIETGSFLNIERNDYFKDTKISYLNDIKSIKTQTLFIADTDLNLTAEAIDKTYKGKVVILPRDSIQSKIINGEDCLVALSPTDECKFKLDNTPTLNVKTIINAKSGKCYYRRSGMTKSVVLDSKEKYGFEENDFLFFEAPKL